MSDLWWGIDLGGTKIEGVVVASHEPTKPLARHRIATEAAQGYPHILYQIEKVISELKVLSGASPQVIGFGTPGTLDPQRNTLKNSNTQCLNGTSLRADLERTLGTSVRISNDANCFALAESVGGAGVGARVVFGVIMGTGVGGGIVVYGRVWNGLQGNGGEWGHNVLEVDGKDCYCGKRGCVETVISGPALEAWHLAQSSNALSLSEIWKRAEQGRDPHATATITHLCEQFGKAIAVVINILDPEIVVLGGGVSNIRALYDRGRECARRYVFNDRFETKIVPNALGDSAGVFGAAALCQNEPRMHG